ncbi:MAG TPA: thiamine phosphate synthase [Actinomycetota bacterium]|jgi:thiamine-phosphate pyrophosphorylase|nr:thiamine phosphate synthase [Actinomycetota bacterium]
MPGRNLALDVYVVTSAGRVPGRGHADVALAAASGGADAVQLRAPELSDDDLLAVARELAPYLRTRGVLFVVNDRVGVALQSGAEGVHLGQDDLSDLESARGGRLVLGISVESPDQARVAEKSGADYLGVTVWATATKPEARPVGLEGLRAVVAATALPVVGIGGVDPSNAAQVIGAGATGVAVVSAVGAAPDPVAATRALVELVGAEKHARQSNEEAR